MNAKELAAKLNGMAVNGKMEALADTAADSGLVIAYCTPNELLELQGAGEADSDVYESTDLCVFVFDGEYCLFDRQSLGDKDDADDYEYAAHEAAEKGRIVQAIAQPADVPGAAWLVRPAFAHESFDLLQGGKVYCRGAVFNAGEVA
ncbi:hypothetical protein [Taibaiella chishuiensis]|uniref:Uncharacterized protein n=1 Tax=Taibaiella chishuiensis TaxID=1434707 RepID=A0A2P8DAH5_9BACT|nr:hypothetical protein [Taibaiella chishuiensis]PSK94228.1 hypothetical protein B0I18_101383 [Taibaiella chishuiensis]